LCDAERRAGATTPFDWRAARDFRSTWMGLLFIISQLLLIFSFFHWPAGHAGRGHHD